jgi:hypothetical protein
VPGNSQCLTSKIPFRWYPADHFFTGVKFFRLLTQNDKATIPEDSSNSKKKKIQQQLQRLMQERQVAVQELQPRLMAPVEFYDEFNYVVSALLYIAQQGQILSRSLCKISGKWTWRSS